MVHPITVLQTCHSRAITHHLDGRAVTNFGEFVFEQEAEKPERDLTNRYAPAAILFAFALMAGIIPSRPLH